MNKLQQMEEHALRHGYCMREFDKENWAEVIDEAIYLRYTFNGVYKSRGEIKELIPNINDNFEE